MNNTFKIIVTVFLLLMQVGCKNSSDSPKNDVVHVVSSAEFKEKSAGQTILDIRTPQEFQQGYIEGAVNVNLYDKDFADKISQFDKSKPIFIYCLSGSRSESASKKLANMGFVEVYDLDGGIRQWNRDKQKLVK